jgi:hypothetical protein
MIPSSFNSSLSLAQMYVEGETHHALFLGVPGDLAVKSGLMRFPYRLIA